MVIRDLAILEATLEPAVVYTKADQRPGDPKADIWVRTVKNFLEQVLMGPTEEQPPGMEPRFVRVK